MENRLEVAEVRALGRGVGGTLTGTGLLLDCVGGGYGELHEG